MECNAQSILSIYLLFYKTQLRKGGLPKLAVIEEHSTCSRPCTTTGQLHTYFFSHPMLLQCRSRRLRYYNASNFGYENRAG
ncbi:hypothetical protein A0H81_02469 [Grifola frondosa]|uniref:Uncharacterized protein n=1 Tax=Grifola frondosa TaxID=5627 RepID=A0A1C7MTR6_GRIFR|nr:hypothetical protein A0H81_02469 [Grifola frondosa]